MSRLQRVAAVLVIAGTMGLYGLALPYVADRGPQARHLDQNLKVDLSVGSVVLPAGWDADIESTSQSQPLVTSGDVTVLVTDGVWFGSSSRLVANVNALMLDGAATLPEVPDDANGATEERWELSAGQGAESVAVTVVRRDVAVLLVIVRGGDMATELEAEQIAALVDSVEIEELTVNVEAAS